MSDGYGAAGAAEPSGGSANGAGKVETVKQEAVAVDHAAMDAAGDVVATTKDEAASVAREAKVQVQDLYRQTRAELDDQASHQQARIASGLRAVGDELGSMARNSDASGVAGDVVQRVSSRVSGAASWLDTRDPSAVLGEVKSFARRRPVAFIVGALVVGAVAGRLTRALASGADESSGSTSGGAPTRPDYNPGRRLATPVDANLGSVLPSGNDDDAQLYTELVSQYDGQPGGSDERRDAV